MSEQQNTLEPDRVVKGAAKERRNILKGHYGYGCYRGYGAETGIRRYRCDWGIHVSGANLGDRTIARLDAACGDIGSPIC
jgi:hypothetical protein